MTGRPRLAQRRRQGQTPRAEILDAAAELFTTQGYANTSTRAVADAVGIRQASLYHHFASKDDILDALLAETIAAPLELVAKLMSVPATAAAKPYGPAWLAVSQLCSSTWNLGGLYLLPELRTARFEYFRLRRDELHGHYETLAAAAIDEAGPSGVPGTEVFPFRLVETVINIRSDEGAVSAEVQQAIPDAALRMLGRRGDLEPVLRQARELVAACS